MKNTSPVNSVVSSSLNQPEPTRRKLDNLNKKESPEEVQQYDQTEDYKQPQIENQQYEQNYSNASYQGQEYDPAQYQTEPQEYESQQFSQQDYDTAASEQYNQPNYSTEQQYSTDQQYINQEPYAQQQYETDYQYTDQQYSDQPYIEGQDYAPTGQYDQYPEQYDASANNKPQDLTQQQHSQQMTSDSKAQFKPTKNDEK